jgi:hypothetical protein
LFYSCFNSPDELNNYNYRTDGTVNISVHDGILEISSPGSGGPTTSGVTTKNTFPGSNIRVKARIDANTDTPIPRALYTLIIASDSNYDPIIPLSSDRGLVFGYSPPYLYYASYWDTENEVDLYTGGSWNGGETGYHTFEVALYPDRIELYINGNLVKTYNGNPLANDQVHIGFMYNPYGEYRAIPNVATLRADWLFIDPVSAPPGDPPDLKQLNCGGTSSGVGGSLNDVASSIMNSLAGTLENITSFISGNINTIAGVVFASGFTLMLYKSSRRITSAVMRLVRR